MKTKREPGEKRTVIHSLQDAGRGIWDGVRMERNLRIHITTACYVLFSASFLGLTRGEIAVLLLTIGSVITAEMLNTAVEKFCDFNQREYSPQIRLVKDVAAGAVFVAAVFAVAIGIVILCRPALPAFILLLVTTPLYCVLLAVSLILAWFFIFWGPIRISQIFKHRPKGR